MSNEIPEKMDLHSMDISEENRLCLKQLFPAVFTETYDDKDEMVESVDFERLKAEIGKFSDVFESRRERYGMDWPGKKDALKLIQQPSIATLKPCRDESVNFDSTENLFIEGDNLEVLKLLQKSYYGKIKMIYIDPPYNTGEQFIYPDKYSETLETYLAYAGLIDNEGKKFATNTPNEGRFHTKWLNMMYPRLYLARNLLKDDGVIFISIDDNEVANLRKLCDEIFGEENFIGTLVIQSNPRGSQEPFGISSEHEYVLCYGKTESGKSSIIGYEREGNDEEFSFIDEYGRNARLLGLRKRGGDWRREDRPNMYYAFYVDPNTKKVSLYKDDIFTIEVFPVRPDGSESRWTWGKEKTENNLHLLTAKNVNRGNKTIFDIYRIDYLENEQGIKKREKVKSIWQDKELNYQYARQFFKIHFDSSEIFDFPKSPHLIEKMASIFFENNYIVLDFFAGSCTTAHAIMDLNKEDGGNRKFIMVQLPEPCEENSEAYKAGYKNIAEIGKERIRRVINKIEEEQKAKQSDMFKDTGKKLDLGFKALKLDKSNFKIWEGLSSDASEEEIALQLEMHIDHISTTATQEDILYELLLKAGFMPTEKIERLELEGKKVFSIAGGALLICLENEITQELVDSISKIKPKQFICLDKAFQGNDQLKTNAVQTFAALNQGKDKNEQIVFRTV